MAVGTSRRVARRYLSLVELACLDRPCEATVWRSLTCHMERGVSRDELLEMLRELRGEFQRQGG
jgi:hypothetical protein